MKKKAFWFYRNLLLLFSLIAACSTTPNPLEPSQDPEVEVHTPIASDIQPTEAPSPLAIESEIKWDSIGAKDNFI